MHIILLLALGVLQATAPDSFSVQADLQGRYDEISQAMLQFTTETDVDDFHAVMYTPDWVFVDTTGHRHSWDQLRDEAVHALQLPHPESIVQSVQTMSLVPGGAAVVLDLTTVRTIVDSEGRYGPTGSSHRIAETTRFRDSWIASPEGWKLKSREQVGAPKVRVDKPDSGL